MEQGGVRPHPGDSPDRDQAPLLTTGASVSNDRQPAAMAMTTAERQRAFRRRQTDHIATLEQENAQLRAALADVLAEAERLDGMHAPGRRGRRRPLPRLRHRHLVTR